MIQILLQCCTIPIIINFSKRCFCHLHTYTMYDNFRHVIDVTQSKSTGPKTGPCGTPHSTLDYSEKDPATPTRCFLPITNCRAHVKTFTRDATSFQFCHQTHMWDITENLCKVQIHCIDCSCSINISVHWSITLVFEQCKNASERSHAYSQKVYHCKWCVLRKHSENSFSKTLQPRLCSKAKSNLLVDNYFPSYRLAWH